jgi:hypothetical protein
MSQATGGSKLLAEGDLVDRKVLAALLPKSGRDS